MIGVRLSGLAGHAERDMETRLLVFCRWVARHPRTRRSVHFIFLNISIGLESARTLLTHIGHRHTLLLALVVLT